MPLARWLLPLAALLVACSAPANTQRRAPSIPPPPPGSRIHLDLAATLDIPHQVTSHAVIPEQIRATMTIDARSELVSPAPLQSRYTSDVHILATNLEQTKTLLDVTTHLEGETGGSPDDALKLLFERSGALFHVFQGVTTPTTTAPLK